MAGSVPSAKPKSKPKRHAQAPSKLMLGPVVYIRPTPRQSVWVDGGHNSKRPPRPHCFFEEVRVHRPAQTPNVSASLSHTQHTVQSHRTVFNIDARLTTGGASTAPTLTPLPDGGYAAATLCSTSELAPSVPDGNPPGKATPRCYTRQQPH